MALTFSESVRFGSLTNKTFAREIPPQSITAPGTERTSDCNGHSRQATVAQSRNAQESVHSSLSKRICGRRNQIFATPLADQLRRGIAPKQLRQPVTCKRLFNQHLLMRVGLKRCHVSQIRVPVGQYDDTLD